MTVVCTERAAAGIPRQDKTAEKNLPMGRSRKQGGFQVSKEGFKGLPHALSEGLDLKAFAQSPVAPPAALRASGARLARPSRESPLERRGRTARSRDLLLLLFVPTVKVFRRGAWSCQGASAPPS